MVPDNSNPSIGFFSLAQLIKRADASKQILIFRMILFLAKMKKNPQFDLQIEDFRKGFIQVILSTRMFLVDV